MCRNPDIQGVGLNTEFSAGHYSRQQFPQQALEEAEHWAELKSQWHQKRVDELRERLLQRRLRKEIKAKQELS